MNEVDRLGIILQRPTEARKVVITQIIFLLKLSGWYDISKYLVYCLITYNMEFITFPIALKSFESALILDILCLFVWSFVFIDFSCFIVYRAFMFDI